MHHQAVKKNLKRMQHMHGYISKTAKTGFKFIPGYLNILYDQVYVGEMK